MDIKRLLIHEQDRFPLDKLPPASFAYSFRQLRVGYNSFLSRVRNGNNVEQDVGLPLDLSLMNHVGRQNLFSFSEEFNNVIWGVTGASVTPNNAVAPDGMNTADTIVENSAITTQHRFIRSLGSLNGGVTYTLSVYVRRGSGTRSFQLGISGGSLVSRIYFDLGTGAIVNTQNATGTIDPVGNFYRVSLTTTTLSTATHTAFLAIAIGTLIGNETYTGNGTSSIVIWGGQLNIGALQPYIATGAASATGNGFATAWYDQSGLNKTISQATEANQPLSVSNGFSIRFRGNRGLSFDSTNHLSGNGVSINYNGSAFSFSGAADIYPVFNGNTLMEVIGFDIPLSGQDKSYLLANQQRYYNL